MIDLSTFLERFEIQLREALNQDLPKGLEESRMLDDAGAYLSTSPGAKRARPRLVYHFGTAIGAPQEALLDIAVAGEFIHAASLLHDDVVDEGTLRRGRPTVNAKWNNATAVLGGDVMLCTSIRTLANLPRPITNEAVEVVAIMSRAAILEVESRGNAHLPIDTWKAIAQGKTGVLFGWCGRSPARLIDDANAMERFKTCGEHLGMAFQMADDLKDITSGDSGKNRFADIVNRNPSYPLLFAAARDATIKQALQDLWQKPSISNTEADQMGQRVLATGASTATQEAMLQHVDLAFEALGPYRDQDGGREVVQWAQALCQLYLSQAQIA